MFNYPISMIDQRRKKVILSDGSIVNSDDPLVALDQKKRLERLYLKYVITNWIYIVGFLTVVAAAVYIHWMDVGWFGLEKKDIPVQRWEPNSIVPQLIKQKGFVREILNQAGTNSVLKSVKRFLENKKIDAAGLIESYSLPLDLFIISYSNLPVCSFV